MSKTDDIRSEQLRQAASRSAAQQRKRGPGGPGGPPGPGTMMSGEKANDFLSAVRKLFSFMRRFRVQIIVGVVCAMASAAFYIAGPKILSLATTELFEGAAAKIAGTGGIDFASIARILAITLVLYIVSAACSFAEGWVMTSVSQRTCYELRRAIDEKIHRLPLSYFERTSTGDVLSRITNDVDTLGQSLNQGITQLITSATTLVGVVVMMLSINVLMTLITFIILPVSLALIFAVVRVSQKYFVAQQNTLGQINGLVEETFSGQSVVRAFNREAAACDEFSKTNDVLFESAWKSQFLSGLMMPIMNFVGNLGYVAVAIAGSVFAVQGIITVGDIQAFVQYVKNFTQPITQLSQVGNVLQQMAAASERIFNFLDEVEEPQELTRMNTEGAAGMGGQTDKTQAEKAVCVNTESITGGIEFDHVSFSYDKKTPVITDFSARIEEGQTVALVGPTGAGKTTMVKLLMRFYDVDGGVIRIGGVDVRDFSRSEVRAAFGMVLQDTWLFSGTVRENIRYGNLEASDDEVEAAANAAFVDHFIRTLPQGYDTIINEDGTNISQGQRQLLTIARAVLANRNMLILDEATSSVDTRTEKRLQKAMTNLMTGRTSFVIAHRLSTIKNADLILVMQHGDIVEQGTHEELLLLGGVYRELYTSQFEECS